MYAACACAEVMDVEEGRGRSEARWVARDSVVGLRWKVSGYWLGKEI